MVDLDELRQTLRAREPLAPDPGEVLAGADRRFREVRARRRVVAAAAVVAVTTVGLSVGIGMLRQHNTGPVTVPVAAPPADAPVPAPSLPFSLDNLSGGYRLVSWAVAPDYATASYESELRGLEISVQDVDPEASQGDPPVPTTVNGTPGYLRWYAQSGRVRVSWRLENGKWGSVTTNSSGNSVQLVVQLASSLRLAPAPVPTAIRSMRAPVGLSVRGWDSAAQIETVTLCPSEDRTASCVTVTAGKPGALPVVPTPAGQPDRLVMVGGVPYMTTQDGRVLERRTGPAWVSIHRSKGDPSILPGIANSLTFD